MSNKKEENARARSDKRARERAIAEERIRFELFGTQLEPSVKLKEPSVQIIQEPKPPSWPRLKNRRTPNCKGGVCNNVSRRHVELVNTQSGPKLKISLQGQPKMNATNNKLSENIQEIQQCQGLLCHNNYPRRLNNVTGQLKKLDEKVSLTLSMFHELIPVIQETRDASVGGQENIAEVSARMDTGFGKLRTLYKNEYGKITNPLDYIYLYYYTLYTFLRLACESLISISKPFREYIIALPCGLSILVILIYMIMFLLFLFIYETGIFFGSLGVLHYYGRQHDIFAVIVSISIKLIGAVCLTLWDLKGFFKPYVRIMKNAVINGFKLNDQTVSESAGAVKDYVQNKTSTAVSHIVNQSVSAALDRIPTISNFSSAVAAGVAYKAVGAKDAIASGAADVGAAIASGAVGAKDAIAAGAADVGTAIASGAADVGTVVASGARKASEFGTVVAESEALKAAGKAASNAAEAAATATKKVAGKASEAASAAAGKASEAAGKASEWLYSKLGDGKRGGGLLVLDRFKEFDKIHILHGLDLKQFNKSKIGIMLELLKTNMDVMVVNNVEENMRKTVNANVLSSVGYTINVLLDNGVPLLINELKNSIPLCEYIKEHKVVLKQKKNEELLNALCTFDIVGFYAKNRLSKHLELHKTLKHVPKRHARITRRQSFS
jgi:hypothetical protein